MKARRAVDSVPQAQPSSMSGSLSGEMRRRVATPGPTRNRWKPRTVTAVQMLEPAYFDLFSGLDAPSPITGGAYAIQQHDVRTGERSRPRRVPRPPPRPAARRGPARGAARPTWTSAWTRPWRAGCSASARPRGRARSTRTRPPQQHLRRGPPRRAVQPPPPVCNLARRTPANAKGRGPPQLLEQLERCSLHGHPQETYKRCASGWERRLVWIA